MASSARYRELGELGAEAATEVGPGGGNPPTR